MSIMTTTASTNESSRPYYLLWGYRECGADALSELLVRSGLNCPEWSESNVWIAAPSEIDTAVRRLWGRSLDDPYLVDMSTLTHLGQTDPASVLAPLGFTPSYVVCTREPGARSVSAWHHMRIKRADKRELRDYLKIYEGWLGLSRSDLRDAEEDLIQRDLCSGQKLSDGLLTGAHFARAHPVAFKAAPMDPCYKFRYLGETLDMLDFRPGSCTVLPLEDPSKTVSWISSTFGLDTEDTVGVDPKQGTGPHPDAAPQHRLFSQLKALLPLGLREPLGRWFEQRSTSLKGPRMIQESGERMAMTELVNELVGPSPLAGDRVA